MEFDIVAFLAITVLTLAIVAVASRRCSVEKKLVIYMLALSIYIYSGVGIALDSVDNIYIVHYLIFLSVLFASVRLFSNEKIRFTLGKGSSRTSTYTEKLEKLIEKNLRLIRVLGIVFIISMFVPIIYPTNRLLDMLNITSFTSIGIHMRQQLYQDNIIVKICNNISLIAQPFFFIYLYQLIERKKQKIGVSLILLWVLLEFGQLNYLSRYEMIIFFLFLVMYLIIVRRGEIQLDTKWVVIIGILAVFSLPMLVNFTEIRLGRTGSHLTITEAAKALIGSECDYPIYYDRCVENAGLINPFLYILWIIFLPIPSVIWPSKPAVKVSHIFTSLITGVSSVSSVGYYNVLPSILGESFLIFGEYFFWVEGIILGFIIGFYFKFFLKSKKLSLLTVYMVLMLSTIGRGGSQSYIPVIVNGSVYFWLWTKIR